MYFVKIPAFASSICQTKSSTCSTVNCLVRHRFFSCCSTYKAIRSKKNAIGNMKILALTAIGLSLLSSCAGAPSPSNANSDDDKSQVSQRTNSENTIAARDYICVKPSNCSWSLSGKCEKYCGYDSSTGHSKFTHTKGCGWGRKQCCCGKAKAVIDVGDLN